LKSTFVLRGAAISLAAVLSWSCGDGGPECGDGIVEGDEQCDDGNQVNNDSCNNACFAPSVDTTDLAIRWSFNGEAAPGFDGDTCFDIGAGMVSVELSGPAELSGEAQCGFSRVSFLDVPAGTYDVTMRVVDLDGELLTNGPVTAQVEVADEDVMATVDVPFDAWKNDYTGTFFFRVTWAGGDCNDAKPTVAEHSLLLERDGVPIGELLTDANDPIDGSGRGDCRSVDPSIEEFPQSVLEVPFGPAEFEIVGYDPDGGEAYRERFETFVGAGFGNPELVFDVDLVGGDGGDGDGDGGGTGAVRLHDRRR